MQPLLQQLSILFLVLVSILNIILAYAVLRTNRTKATNKLYAALSFTVTIWLIIMYIAIYHIDTAGKALFWARASTFVAAPMSMLFFLFAHTLPSEKIELKKKWLILSLVSTALAMVLATFANFTGTRYVDGKYEAIPGPGMAFFSVVSTIFSVGAVYVLIRKFRRFKGIQKKQAQYVALGIALMLGLIISTILVPVVFLKNYNYIPLSPIYAFIFLSLSAYAIIKHKLFDLKVLATQIFVVALNIVLLANVFVTEEAQRVLAILVFLMSIIVGFLLIRSVIKEVKQRDELILLTNRLKKANKKLQELLQLKTEFVGIASHQLRTPLTSLRGLLDMQASGDLDSLPKAEQKMYQRNMLISANRLSQLINDLINSTRMEGGVMLRIEKVDVNELIENIVDELRENFEKKGLYLKFKPHKDLPIIEADRRYLHEALSNLIDNSEKYTIKGGTTVSLLPQADRVEIRVTDTGIGITEDEGKKVWQKFVRGQKSTLLHTEGSGLGLFIVKRIIQAHNGHVTFDSAGRDKGTTFHVVLPVTHEE